MTGGTAQRQAEASDDITIEAFETVMSDRLSDLLTKLEKVEAALSDALNSGQRLTDETAQTLQSLDHARQNAKDLLAIVTHVTGKLDWSTTAHVSLAELYAIVDMKDTLAALSEGPGAPGPSEDYEMWM
ncbi:hypothetical protein [Pseudooceanicola sp. MF1-13]|uniref:hypothetical protein n=1 Tax=Pseudooceanicola sp. MF1-13 TaxID=3379095 RepID=UPI0038915554